MKKAICTFLILATFLSLYACGDNTGNGPTNNKSSELILETKNIVDSYADFTLIKISTTKKITASLDDTFFMKTKMPVKHL